MIALVASCTAADETEDSSGTLAQALANKPTFVYGRQWSDADGTYVQRDTEVVPDRLTTFAVPHRPELGVVRANFFIPDREFPGFPGVNGHGNDRTYDSRSDAFASKAAIEIDFETGVGRLFVEKSCINISMAWCLACFPVTPGTSLEPLCDLIPADGLTPIQKCTNITTKPYCLQPHPIRSDPDADNYVATELNQKGSEFLLRIRMSLENAFSNISPVGCAIDDLIDVYYTANSGLRVTIKGDPYPAREAYWYKPDGTEIPFLQEPAGPNGPGTDLCPDERYFAPTPYRIMLTGDSITHGSSGDFSWRYRLHEHLRNSGVPFDFVGPYRHTHDPAAPPGQRGAGPYAPEAGELWDDDHNATWGRLLAHEVDTIGGFVRDHRPDLIVVALGTNDLNKVFSGSTPQKAADDMQRLIDNARAANPDVDFVLVQIAVTGPLQAQNVDVELYNQLLGKIAQEKDTRTSEIVAADVQHVFDYHTDTYDETHPNVRGELVIAKSVADALRKHFGLGMSFGPILLPPAPPKPTNVVVAPDSILHAQPFTVTWSSAAASDVRYRVEVREHACCGSKLIWTSDPTTSRSVAYTGPLLERSGTYQVFVVAIDDYSQYAKSAPAELHVHGGPPKVTGIQVSPARAIGRNQLFTVTWPRVQNDVWTEYRVELHEHSLTGFREVWRSGQTDQLEINYSGPRLPKSGTYQIVVVSIDTTRSTETVSDPVDLVVSEGGPPWPTQVTVTPGLIAQSQLFTVQWNPVFNPGFPTKYRVELRTHRGFGYKVIWASELTEGTEATYTGDTLPLTGTYHVVVVATDGILEAASDPVELQVVEGGPPRPTNVRTSPQPIGRNQLFRVDWDRVVSDAWTEYRVELRTHRRFGYQLIWKSKDTRDTHVTYTGDTLPLTGTYEIVVIALNQPLEAASAPIPLQVVEGGPARVTNVEVAPKSIAMSQLFTVRWPRIVDPTMWILYRVQVRLHREYGYKLVWESPETSATEVVYTGDPLPLSGTYHVTIIANGGGGLESASAPVELSVDGGGPLRPASPALSPSTIVIGNGFRATFGVTANPEIAYKIQVRNHRGYGYRLVWESAHTRSGSIDYMGPALTEGTYHVLLVATNGWFEAASPPAPLEVIGSDAAP